MVCHLPLRPLCFFFFFFFFFFLCIDRIGAAPAIPQYTSQGVNQSATISYQVHSYNDLNEWPQILKKRTYYFKIDPHYMDASFCKSQVGFVPQDPRGCFVLNHDAPITLTQYNVTNDVLTFISDPSYASFFRDPTHRFYIALCWKYVDGQDPCSGDPVSKNWTSLVDDFYSQATSVISKLALNVEFIMDGSGTPSSKPCLINKWRPWVSTWIPSQDPPDAAFSNNVTLGYDRFQVFNAPEVGVHPSLWIDYYQNFDYGKFSSGNYSYLVWEPSDQSDILEISEAYAGGPIHNEGLRFAINIDPAMLEVYAGQASGVSWNYNIVADDQVDYPQVEILAGANNSSFYVLTVYFNFTDMMSHYTVSWAHGWTSEALSSVVSLNSSVFSSSLKPPMNVSSVSVIGSSTVFVSASDGLYAVYKFDDQTLSLTLMYNGMFENSDPRYAVRTNAFLAEDDTTNSFHVLQLRMSPHLLFCQLYAQVWLFTDNLLTTVGDEKCIQSGASVVDFDVAVLGGTSSSQACGTGIYPGIIMYSDSDYIVFAAYICIDIVHKSITINGNKDETLVVNVDVGTSPSVSMVQLDNEIYVLSMHGDTYCWNNEVHNKQASARLCDNNPFSMPYMLAYNFGKFDDWANHIYQQLHNAHPVDTIFSSCHSTILHGSHDSGSHPSTAIFSAVDPLSKQEVLLFAEVHKGLPANVVDKYMCGMPIPVSGLVLDGWPISQWVLS